MTISFWIGTEAELIKVLPVMQSLADKNIKFNILATGQNPIAESQLLKSLSKAPDLFQLTRGPRKKTALSLLSWFFNLLIRAVMKVPSQRDKVSILLIHGDTISTLGGALIGAIKGYKIGHIEAGLRSFNYFKPFPEEICRVLSSRLVDYHYCPNEGVLQNLPLKAQKYAINTKYNTLIDSLQHSQTIPARSLPVPESKYFVFVLHRQENLFDSDFVKKVISYIRAQSKKIHCIFIVHENTKTTLVSLNLYESLLAESGITSIPRQDYFQFMKILAKAEFLVTDGGSNQEESYYLGLPCLVLRDVTERNEGLGHNVILTKSNWTLIEDFFQNHLKFKHPPLTPENRPSEIIAEHLSDLSLKLSVTKND